jgi:hypothetical protein
MICFLCKKKKSTLFGNFEDPGREICATCANKPDTHIRLYPNCTVSWHDSHDHHAPEFVA